MSGLLKTQIQLGDSATATQNFVITSAAADGTLKIARGNYGATTQDILTVDASGNVTATQPLSVPTATAAAHAVRLDQLVGDSSVTNRTVGNLTTSSTSLVDLTDASITLTTKARRIAFAFSCMAGNNTANISNIFNVNIDGTLLFGTAGLAFETNAANDTRIITLSGITAALTAASHTIKVQWSVDSGAAVGTVYATGANTFRFSAWEI